ncbi:MAG TPA: YncE family protein, partial [Pirellulaceae bacterium]|nr:YncE family protein [Pirellulaceae bacterium]
MKPSRLLALLLFSVSSVCCVVPLTAAELATQLRRPIALVQSADGRQLFVANRDSGSVSVIDIGERQVVAEQAIGKRLADLAALPGSDRLLAIDEAAHELLLLQPGAEGLEIIQRLPVSPYPVTICVLPGGKQATIASLWSQRLTFVELGKTLKIDSVLDLPFAPRCQLVLQNDGRRSMPATLLVADSFSGRLALIDPANRKLTATREFPGHNVRGLGASPDGRMLIVAHQMLNELAHSIRN